MYLVIDALRVKIKEDALVRGKAIYLAPIYTIDAIESMNARLRKIIKTRGHVPKR